MMTDRRLSIIAAVLVLLGSMVGLRADVLSYASAQTGSTTSSFGVLDLTTGAFTQIATLNVFVNDLALASNGALYGLDVPFGSGPAEFFTINPSNGTITNIAANTVGLNSIGFSANGTLYGTSFTGTGPEALYSINPATGAPTFIANLSGAVANDANQLRFVGNTAYTTDFVTPSSLYTIDLATGAGTLVGNTGLNRNNGLGGAVGGELFDITHTNPGAEVVSINSATGAATAGPSLTNFYVFTLETPEPGSAILIAGALAFLVAMHKRQSPNAADRRQAFWLVIFSSVAVAPSGAENSVPTDSK